MQTVGDLIDRNAAYYPQRDALVLDDRRVSFDQFARRARRLANAFYALGLRHQDRVGVLSTNNIEYFEIFGACETAGYITALYNFRSAGPEIAYLIEDSAPRVVIFELAFADLIDGLRSRFPDIHWVCITPDEAPEWAQSFDALAASGGDHSPTLRSSAGDIVYLFYTSGTTGRPKGVPWTHASAMTAAQREGRTLGAGARVFQVSPAFHVGGKLFSLGAMFLGGVTVLDRGFDPGRFLAIVQRERITNTFMVPMMMQAVLGHPQFDAHDLSSLRTVMSASTAIPAPLLEQAIARFGPVFYVAYGSTETGNIASLETFELRPTGSAVEIERLNSVGHFQPELDCALLDEEGHPCVSGQVGEVCVNGYAFQGYWNNSVATLEATRGGWFHTGDLGYLDPEGYLFLVDRKKDMVISGGENIYSREVENALVTHPAVRDASVIGVPDEKWGEVVKAVVVLNDGCEIDEDDIIAHCRQQIARYKAPRSVVFVDAFPMLGTGKVDKTALRRLYRGESA